MIRKHNIKNKNNYQKVNENNKKENDSNLEVMNYLIQKLDFRQKKIIKFKNLFKELDSFESFYSQRKEIYLLLNNLEEDLKQASYAIKALLLQNKSLIKEINTKISENKNLSNELKLIIGENQNLKMKLENLNIPERKMNEIMNNENNYNDLVNVNIDSIKVDDEGEFDEPKMKNINLKSNTITNSNSYNNENDEFNQDNNFEQLSNVRDIMNEMRNNKRSLKKIIEEHLKEQNQSNNS